MSTVYETVPPPTVRRVSAEEIKISVEVNRESDHNFWSDLTFDVDSGGVFVSTYHALPIGAVVEIELGIEGEAPQSVRGVVRWTRAHGEGSDASAGIGVEVVAATDETRSRMRAFAEGVRAPMLFEVDDTTSSEGDRASIH